MRTPLRVSATPLHYRHVLLVLCAEFLASPASSLQLDRLDCAAELQSRLHHRLLWGNGLQSMDDIRLQHIWYWQVDRAPFLNLPSTDGMPLADLIIIAGCSEIFCWTSYMPINANGVYDNTGGTFNGASLLDECVKLSPGKYAEYGPPFTPLITPFSRANPMLGTPGAC